jgi:transcriptional regulator with XRE-family HTH domain
MTRSVQEPPAPAAKSGWVPEPATFGTRLLLVRREMGWHNADAAAREYGLPKESYRYWEKDLSVPRHMIESCLRISARTGVDFGWLFGGPTMAGRTAEEVIKDSYSVTCELHTVAVQPMEDTRPPDNRPIGRPRSGRKPQTGPSPVRPALIPRRPGR